MYVVCPRSVILKGVRKVSWCLNCFSELKKTNNFHLDCGSRKVVWAQFGVHSYWGSLQVFIGDWFQCVLRRGRDKVEARNFLSLGLLTAAINCGVCGAGAEPAQRALGQRAHLWASCFSARLEVFTSEPSIAALGQTFKRGSEVPHIARAFSCSMWEPSFIFLHFWRRPQWQKELRSPVLASITA